MPGYVASLFLKTAHGQPMRAVDAIEAVGGRGLLGDASFGRQNRQVLLVEGETLDGFGLQPGQVRENLVVRGLPLSDMHPGEQLVIGEALFEITGECTPCRRMDDLRPGLQSAIHGRRGVLAKVVRGGMVRIGDGVSAAGLAEAISRGA